jgi:hypothetical protein
VRYRKLSAQVHDHGDDIRGQRGYRAVMQMRNFHSQVGTILGTLADIVQPPSFEDLERSEFGDPEA